jgi:hypothetical protein
MAWAAEKPKKIAARSTACQTVPEVMGRETKLLTEEIGVLVYVRLPAEDRVESFTYLTLLHERCIFFVFGLGWEEILPLVIGKEVPR